MASKKSVVGYYPQYGVFRLDGDLDEGERHQDCVFFVIDVQHDPHARDALLAYAKSAERTAPMLAMDVRAIAEQEKKFKA